MGSVAGYSRRRGVRTALLASTGLAAFAQIPAAAYAQTTVEETAVELTRRSDTVTLTNVTLDKAETTDLLGFTPNLIGTGVFGDYGNDRITLAGISDISASVTKNNDFSSFLGVSDLLSMFLAANTTTTKAYGVDGGYGANTLNLVGDLTVDALAKASQSEFDLQSSNDLIPVTLDTGVLSTALGLTSDRGRSRATNSSELNVTSTADFDRLDFTVDLAGVDLSSWLTTSDAIAIGLAGDRYTDYLTNAADGVVTVKSFGTVSSTGISLQAAKIVSAENASQARATSAAMAGAGGNDILTNDGVLTSEATSTFSETNIAIAVKELSPPSSLLPESETNSLSLAVATGMDGGAGADKVTNNGHIDLTSFADFNQFGLEVTDGGISPDAVVTVIDNFSGKDGEEGEEAVNQGAVAEIVGLRGDERGASIGGADILTNAGDITGTATADSDVTSVDVGLPFSEVYKSKSAPTSTGGKVLSFTQKALESFDLGLMDYSSDAAAFADGVRGGAGNDRIDNTGLIDITAHSMSNTVGVGVSAFDALPDGESSSSGGDEPLSINSTVFNATANSVAHSVGLSGGDEDDFIQNDDTVKATADADAASTEVDVELAMEEKALQVEVPFVLSQTKAVAAADGVNAGDGFDTVKNNGALTSTADASAKSTDVSLGFSIIETGGGVNATIVDKDITADAIAVGIRDGLGTDSVDNTGTIDATATSNASSTSVDLNLTVNTTKGLAATGGFIKADQVATSHAFGVERIIDDRDADASFTSTGEIDATANATSIRTTVAADVAFTDAGLSVAAPILSIDNDAIANAGALVSFEADDVFTAFSDMTAKAGANATSTSVGVSGGVTVTGVGAGVAALKASTTTDSDATLLSFGTGDDTVTNGAVLLADSDAVSRSNGVTVAAGGTNKGLAIGASLIDSTTNAFAHAMTIATGDDDDVVTNDSAALAEEGADVAPGEIKADALADASSTDVGVSIAAIVGTEANPGVGVGLSAALARSGLRGEADAKAVDLGAGADEFTNADAVSSIATGKAHTEAVNVALSGSMIGGAVSGALGDTSVTAKGNATGAEGGAGADVLSNTGALTSTATGDANTVGVGVSGSVAAGFAAGASGVLADTTADSTALGMNGGAGQDDVSNSGDVTISSNGDAANTSVSVNINVAPTGLAVGAAIVSARTTADSNAVGLAGDADGLNEDDETTDDDAESDVVKNLAGVIDVTSRAEATANSVGVNGQYNGFGGVALISDTTSNSTAIGLFGGSGGDMLYNAATITTKSTALGNGPAVAVNPVGANIGDINTAANAFSYGLDGGVGADFLMNEGGVSSTATSTVTGDLVQVTLLGGTVGDLTTASRATAYGMFGNDGDDSLMSSNALTSNATASVTGTSVAVNFAGASFADVGTIADAAAAGAAGGDGANTFSLDGAVNATSNANARSTNVSVTLLGAAFGDEAAAGTQAFSDSYGYLGGLDADSGGIAGTTTISSTATARNDGGSASVAGASFADTSPEAHAFASIFSGDSGDDGVVYSGDGTVNADANGNAGATSVSLAGASSAKADPLANAIARGLAGDAGADEVTNNGVISTTADSDLGVGRYRVTLVGASIGSISSTSEANAAGLDGGADNDTLRNNNKITSTAKSKLDSDGVDVTLVGANVDTATGDLTAAAVATGVLGGAGDDDINNSGSVTSNSTITGKSGQVGVVIAGAGLVDAASTLEASSVGLDGEGDDDTIVNEGGIAATSTVSGGATNTSVTLVGASKGDSGVRSTATSTAVKGGAGNDAIASYGDSVSTATSTGAALGVEVTVGGALLGVADSQTTAAANGLDGGAGDDMLLNAAGLDLNGTATGRVGRVSVAVAGSDGGASVATDILASATGVSGGDGDDEAENDGLIDIDLSSTTTANSTSVVIAGASKINAGLFSTTNGVGMDGGDDDDIFTNGLNGVIDILATASISASSSSVNIAGVSATNGLLRSRGYGTGMAGGAGNDELYNYGDIHLDVNGYASASGSNFTLAGSATSGGDVKGTTTVYGMDGGAGDDFLMDTGTLYARSDARGTFGSGSYALAGYSGSGGAAGATATTTGLYGGAGLDEILLTGSATSIADARLTVNSNVNVTFGASSTSRSPLGVEAYGRGANGGAGDDMIDIQGVLNTYGYAQISMSNTKFAFAGSASGSNSATSRSEAYGVLGDSGDDILKNSGSLFVSAESKTTGSGAAGAGVGSTSSASEVVAHANALGLYGGAGKDTLINTGTITGEVTNTTKSVNTVSSYAIFSSGQAKSTSTNYGYGTLFYDSQEDTTVINDGTAKLTYFGDRGSLRGVARSESTANGVTVGVGTDAYAESRSYSNVNLRGVRLGDGSHMVTNNGDLEVQSFAFSSAVGTGNGNSAISGDATGVARAYVNGAVLTGVESLSGSLDFVNTGLLSVLNKPLGATSAAGNATGVDITRDPDAHATATVYMNDVQAYGVRSGDAADTIYNSGTISVRSQPEANRALARSKSGGGYSFSVDAFTDAYASANDAAAYGVHAGDGDNIIVNDGEISAVSDPYAKASAESTGYGRDGDAWSRARAYAQNAKAYGIVTGAGADTITNNGTITVAATPGVSATTVVNVGSYCYISTPAVVIDGHVIIPAVRVCEYGEVDKNQKTTSISGKTIVGVSSGDGNDVVTNNGTINASGGTAISLGNGDDTLILGEGASISGSVSAGAGSDTLHFVGVHSWNASGQSFENFIKSGAGTTTLYNPGALAGQTEVFEGVLNISGAIYMSDTSQVTTSIFADGGVGQLASSGVIHAAGDLSVLANEGVYTDGAVYDVVAGSGTDTVVLPPPLPGFPPTIIYGTDGLQGGFDTVTLPEATALRSFSGNYTNHTYRVSAHVAPVSSLMLSASATELSFASALDGAAPTADGAVATTIAALQSLPEEQQVESAVQTLTPELATGSIEIATDAVATGAAATQQRLASFRAGRTGRAAQPAFGFNLSEGQKTARGATAWAAEFDGANIIPTVSNRLSGDVYGMARGYDFATEGGALMGLTMTRLQSDGSLHAFSDGSMFRSTTMTMYGAAPLGDKGYATAALSWGKTKTFGGEPGLNANLANETGFEGESNAAFGVSLEAGRAFRNAPFAPEVFGALNYRTADGAAAAINRMADLTVNVDRGQSSQLESEFGMRLTGEMNVYGASIRPHLAISWVRRYGEGESVVARFADMPDYAFRLRGDLDNRDAVRAKAGLNLFAGKAFEVSASGIGEVGDRKSDLTAELRGIVKF